MVKHFNIKIFILNLFSETGFVDHSHNFTYRENQHLIVSHNFTWSESQTLILPLNFTWWEPKP
ncbi:hypothetical protein [Mycoplasma phage sp.]|nr:hypothetical protein [Mycoplasma phage sp.]QRI43932.1 hypothetical protein [Mycoplasma phage sp.]QRI43967.1 hypothetical protein [Mycoplasma phage sp.]